MYYLTYSDGSGFSDPTKAQYGISSGPDNPGEPEPDWTWEEGLDTTDPAEALRIVTERGFVPRRVPGGWYGDDRDDSYLLDRKLTGAEAANIAGISATSWRSNVSRQRAPQPDGWHDSRTRWWWESTVRLARSAMPGRGNWR